MSRGLIACAFLALALGTVPASSQTSGAGIDLRILLGARVLARHGARPGVGGEAVRIVSADAACDGTLGPDVDTRTHDALGNEVTTTSAEVRGCTVRQPLFAIVRPPAIGTWPAARAPSDARATEAIALAEAAATVAGHLRGETTWDAPRVYDVGGTLHVLVSGPACAAPPCAPSVAALARVDRGAASVVMVRPAHPQWTEEDVGASTFAFVGVTDVDGDGAVELLELQRGDSAFVLRLVRVGRLPAGDVVWLASHHGDPLDASVARPPRPIASLLH